MYSTRAHVFQIDPSTKKSWLPCSKQAVTVSFYYDPNKETHRIISVDGAKVGTHFMRWATGDVVHLYSLTSHIIP